MYVYMKVPLKQGESVIWLFLKKSRSTTISMKRSRRELSIDMVIHWGIFKINQIILLPCLTFIPKTRVSFYCKSSCKCFSFSNSRPADRSCDEVCGALMSERDNCWSTVIEVSEKYLRHRLRLHCIVSSVDRATDDRGRHYCPNICFS